MIGLSLVVNYFFGTKAPLAFSTVAAALIAFFWFASDSKQLASTGGQGEGSFRKAIAAGIVVEYLVVVGLVAYLQGATDKTLPPITEAFVTSFTSIVGVVIAFYFGASAYVEVKSKRDVAAKVGDVAADSASAKQVSPERRAENGDR